MGVVYQARHQLMNRIVAIKMLRREQTSDEKSLNRFKQEAKAISVLAHPNIVSIYDFGISNQGQPYLVMDFLEGVSLAQEVLACGPLPWQRAVDIFLQAATGLAHAHKNGILHRDIKPCNIILLRADQGAVVKIVDFGIAKIFDAPDGASQRLTSTGEVLLSPIYMSPEQCIGRQIDIRSDIYSFGCLMYDVLVGIPPFAGATAAETVTQHITSTPPPFSVARPGCSVPTSLESTVLKALQKDPNKRQQSMQELIASLQLLLPEGKKLEVPTERSPTRPRLALRCKPIWVWFTAVLLFAFLGAVFLKWNPWQTGSTSNETDRLLAIADEDSKRGDWEAACMIYRKLLPKHSSKYGEHSNLEISIRKKLIVALQRARHADEANDSYGELRGDLLYQAESLEKQGKLEACLKCYSELKDLQEQLNRQNSDDYDSCLQRLGALAMKAGKLELATQYLSKSLAYEKTTLASDDHHLLEGETRLARVLTELKKFEEAKVLLLEAAPRLEGRAQYWAYANLAEVYEGLQNRTEPERLWKRLSAIPDPLISDPADIALANRYMKELRYTDAEDYVKKFFNSKIAQVGIRNQGTIAALNRLGEVYAKEGKISELEKLYKNLISTLENDGKSSAKAIDNLASQYRSAHLATKAVELYRSYLARANNITSSDRTLLLARLGETELEINELDKAAFTFKKAASLCEQDELKEPAMYVRVLRGLAYSYYLHQSYQDAARVNLQWRDFADRNLGARSPESLDGLLFAASTYLAMNNPAKVFETVQVILARQSDKPISDIRNFEAHRLLLLSYEAQKDYNSARKQAALLYPACVTHGIDGGTRLDVLIRYQQDLLKLNRQSEAAALNTDIQAVREDIKSPSDEQEKKNAKS